MKLSIVSTLYRSAKYIEEFHQRITTTSKNLVGDSYEIIFIDDGSPDNSLEIATDIANKDNHLIVIELSRNFGHHKAMMTGLGHAQGDYVFLIDSDLEEKPEYLENFWNTLLKSKKLDVVYGVQESRKGNWFEKISGNLFYKLINAISENKISKNFLTIRLMTQDYVKSLTQFKERELNFSTLIALNGFHTQELKLKKLSHSPTTYSLLGKISLFFNAIVSSTAKPLWMIFNFGLIITLFSLSYILYLLYIKAFHGIGIDGWTSVMISISFFGGLIIFFLGFIGIYLSKIFLEVKNRPLTIIRKVHGNQ